MGVTYDIQIEIVVLMRIRLVVVDVIVNSELIYPSASNLDTFALVVGRYHRIFRYD